MKILISLILFVNFSIFAQQLSLQGKVIDAETRLKLADANISILNKPGVGTSTNDEGEFSLKIFQHDSDTLLITFIGYETKIISVKELLSLPYVKISADRLLHIFKLTPKLIPSQTVFVESTIGKKGIAG